MSSPLLEKLQNGSNERIKINHSRNIKQPEDFDWKKFENGKLFFSEKLNMLCFSNVVFVSVWF